MVDDNIPKDFFLSNNDVFIKIIFILYKLNKMAYYLKYLFNIRQKDVTSMDFIIARIRRHTCRIHLFYCSAKL